MRFRPLLLASLPLITACSSSSTESTQDSGPIGGDATTDAPAYDSDSIADSIADAPTDAPEAGAFSTKLSLEGLYSDFGARTIAPGYIAYAPAYALWSDDAGKNRWVWIPPGQTIDTSDMDHWKFPIGTKFFKEFATAGGKLLETRLIERTGDTTYRLGAYVWAADGSEATWTIDGIENILGTDHDVPNLDKCNQCHGAEPGHINGLQAIQMWKPGPGTNVDWLASKGLLSNPPPTGADYSVPGDAVESAALGTLHANCGNCHNPLGKAYIKTNMVLRLSVAERTVVSTAIFTTSVSQPTTAFHKGTLSRIAPGDHAGSAVWIRMSARGNPDEMPPIASEFVDATGLANLQSWIDSLPSSADAGPG